MMVIPDNDVSGVGRAVVQRFRHLTNDIWVVFYRVMYFILCDKPCGVPIKVNRFCKCVDSVVKNGNPYRRHLGSGIRDLNRRAGSPQMETLQGEEGC